MSRHIGLALLQEKVPGSVGAERAELLRRRVCVFIDGLEEAPGGLPALAKRGGSPPLFGGNALDASAWRFVVCIRAAEALAHGIGPRHLSH
eukprot:gene278-24530_t